MPGLDLAHTHRLYASLSLPFSVAQSPSSFKPLTSAFEWQGSRKGRPAMSKDNQAFGTTTAEEEMGLTVLRTDLVVGAVEGILFSDEKERGEKGGRTKDERTVED
jgi:hypothetical protein